MNARPFYTPTTPTGRPSSALRSTSGTARSPASHQASEFPFPSSRGASPLFAKMRLLDEPNNPLINDLAQDDDLTQDNEERTRQVEASAEFVEDWDGMTRLDLTLEKIGMGRYQKTLLIMCGFGWMADNMWLQAVAIILPRVQVHWNISDQWIGLASSSIFAGMMFGAFSWGTYSDSNGRKKPFRYTLLLTSIFGICAAFAPNFTLLCASLFGLGVGVGGSMPTDGTLFLENIPRTYHYLLTALSIFFSLGAVLTSALSLLIIPSYSCPEIPPRDDYICNVEVENIGWRYLLAVLGLISIIMFLSRIVLFNLQESARYLVTTGDTEGAIDSLENITKFNGQSLSWSREDVVDTSFFLSGDVGYDATGESSPIDGNLEEEVGLFAANLRDVEGSGDEYRRTSEDTHIRPSSARTLSQSSLRRTLRRAKVHDGGRLGEWLWNSSLINALPANVAYGIEDYCERIELLFVKKLSRTTQLVWTIWGLVSAAYTIFNVFLPKWIEIKLGTSEGGQVGGHLKKSLEDCLLYTVSGLPGSIIGAYLVETSLGRKATLAMSTLSTAIFVLVFVLVSSQTGVILSTMAVSLAATLMYAVIYSMTPDIFPTEVRGTACGIASALSRLTAMIAPIITGFLLSIDISVPLFTSAFGFFVAAGLMLMLPGQNRPSQSRKNNPKPKS